MNRVPATWEWVRRAHEPRTYEREGYLMSYHKTATLPDRLRAFAEELESAERYGLPMPYGVHVSGHGAEFHMIERTNYDQWCDYIEPVTVVRGGRFDHAEADVNGLRVTVSSAAETSVA